MENTYEVTLATPEKVGHPISIVHESIPTLLTEILASKELPDNTTGLNVQLVVPPKPAPTPGKIRCAQCHNGWEPDEEPKHAEDCRWKKP